MNKLTVLLNWVDERFPLTANWKAHLLVNKPTRAIRNFFVSLLDSRGTVSNFADRHKLASRQRTRECWANASAIADYADVKIITNAFFLGAFDDQILEQPIDGVSHTVRLFLVAFARTKRVGHRTRLINEKHQTRRVSATDFRAVCHKFPFSLSRKFRPCRQWLSQSRNTFMHAHPGVSPSHRSVRPNCRFAQNSGQSCAYYFLVKFIAIFFTMLSERQTDYRVTNPATMFESR